jgi:hypothetical protein
MLKKLSFLIPAAILVIITGCSVAQKDNNLHAVKLMPSAQAVPMVADLEVADKKAMGQAGGKREFKELLEKEAVAEALKQTNGDVLVGVNYFYEYGDSLTVTAMGYPARYKNFRQKEVSKTEANVLVGGNFFYKDGTHNDVSVSVKNAKTDVQQHSKNATPVPVIPAGNSQEE